MSMTNIYVLRLEGGRYYVGKSDNIAKRFQQHVSGYGSAWTKKYKPVALEKSIKNVSPFQEDSITKEYMSKYGIDKVRGCRVHERSCKNTKKNIVINSTKKSGACYRCGRQGHYSPDCVARTHCKGYTLDSDCESDEDSD